MGAIKDVIDLLTQLSEKADDRKRVAELSSLQSLILRIQAEQAELHQTNTDLREERLGLKERIQELEVQIKELSSTSSHAPTGIPTCPNCSTSSKPFYMSPLGAVFRSQLDATHKCAKCKTMVNHKSSLGS